MRSSLASRAPQAFAEGREHKSFDAPPVRRGQKIPGRHVFHKKLPEVAPSQEELEFLRYEEKRRRVKQWLHDSGMNRPNAHSFMNELMKIQYQVELKYRKKQHHPHEVHELRCSPKALAQFVRHFFGSDRKIKAFCEWFYACPDLHDQAIRGLRSRLRGIPYNQLTYQEQGDVRQRLQEYLVIMFKNALTSEYLGKLGRSSESKYELRVVNTDTRRRFFAVVKWTYDHYSIVAFYTESEMNSKRSHRTARQLDYRRRRLH